MDWTTLQKLSYHDIIQYWETHPDVKSKYDTIEFWFSKLDHDFLTGSKQIQLPSYYVKKYTQLSPGSDIYKRWLSGTGENDVVIYRLAHYTYNTSIIRNLFIEAIIHANMILIQYILKIGYELSIQDAQIALQYQQIPVLEMLSTYNIYPKVEMNDLYKYNLDVLHWLANHKCFPYSIVLGIHILYQKQPDILISLLNLGIIPNINDANYFIKCGRLDLLQIIESYGILPNYQGVENAVLNHRLDILQWLDTRGIKSDMHIATKAQELEYWDIVDWLRDKGITIK